MSPVGAEQQTLASKQVGGVLETACPSEDIFVCLFVSPEEALHVYVCIWPDGSFVFMGAECLKHNGNQC